MIVHHFTTPITTPFARKFAQIYGALRRFWENTKIKESAKKPEITGFYRLIKGYKIMIKILFVCHGNICRSPMAEFVFKDMVEKAGLSRSFEIASAATSREEIGNPVHPGTRRILEPLGISCRGKHAVQVTKKDYDYLIGMDSWNIRNMLRIFGSDSEQKVHKLLEFAGRPDDVADPWYTGNFDVTYRDVCEGCRGLLEYIRKNQGNLL